MASNKVMILVSGFSKSGKDFFADVLVQTKGFVKISIANKLKRDVSIKYSVPRIMLDSQEGKDNFYLIPEENKVIKGRDLLIREAKEQRSIDQDFYIKDVIKHIRESQNSKIIIPDVRYLNEINSVKTDFPEYKIISVRINRYRASTVIDPSENQLNNYNFDCVIYNYSNLDAYNEKITQFINNFLYNI
jgi:hypothetical protein